MNMNNVHTQRGGAFFIIMIAIAIFGALSAVLIRGSRTTMSSLTQDQTRLAAQDMISFASAMQKTVQTMRLRGITETQFDFSNTIYTTLAGSAITTANATCTDTSCKIFAMGGGNLNPILPPSGIGVDQSAGSGTNWKAGHVGFRVLRVDGIGSGSPDLVMGQIFLTKELCMQINTLLGVTNPSDAPPVDLEGSAQSYSGTIATFPAPAGYGLGDSASEIIGKSMFCLQNGATDYRFIAVLLSR